MQIIIRKKLKNHTRTPTNCSCRITHDSKYTQETFVANNAMTSVANKMRSECMYM